MGKPTRRNTVSHMETIREIVFDDEEGQEQLTEQNSVFLKKLELDMDQIVENKGKSFRRRGVLKQRRLSRMGIGKQLPLSQASGLKLQWTVGLK